MSKLWALITEQLLLFYGRNSLMRLISYITIFDGLIEGWARIVKHPITHDRGSQASGGLKNYFFSREGRRARATKSVTRTPRVSSELLRLKFWSGLVPLALSISPLPCGQACSQFLYPMAAEEAFQRIKWKFMPLAHTFRCCGQIKTKKYLIFYR